MKSELFGLKGKVAIVTGGNGGIGLGMARGLADAGADIAVVGRNEEKAQARLAKIAAAGGKAYFVSAEASEKSSTEKFRPRLPIIRESRRSSLTEWRTSGDDFWRSLSCLLIAANTAPVHSVSL